MISSRHIASPPKFQSPSSETGGAVTMSGGRPITVLNVAEKPSVAKSVATILSRNQGLRVRDGRSRYNKIFEFNYAIRGQSCNMIVTSVTGHLMELAFEERYRKWYSCDPVQLFHAPVHKFVPEVCFVSSYLHFPIVFFLDSIVAFDVCIMDTYRRI